MNEIVRMIEFKMEWIPADLRIISLNVEIEEENARLMTVKDVAYLLPKGKSAL